MRAKSGQSSQKFFRRTSRSPLDKSRVTSSALGNPLLFDIKSPHNPNFTKISTFQANDHKFLDSTRNLHIVSPQSVHSPTVNLQLSRGNSQGFFHKDSEEMKLTYIPIQSTNTLESIPTIPTKRKKGSQLFEHPLQTARSQELVKLRKQIQTLKSQKFAFLKDQNAKNSQIQRLLEQNCQAKAQVNELQTEKQEIKMKLVSTQKELWQCKNKISNLQLAIETHQLTIEKLNFSIKELSKSLLEAQNEKKQNTSFKGKELQARSLNENGKQIRRRDEYELWSKAHEHHSKPIQTESAMADQMRSKEMGKVESPICKTANLQHKLKNQLLQIQSRDRLNQQLFVRIEEDSKLIECINEAVMAQGLRKIAAKYRTFRASG